MKLTHILKQLLEEKKEDRCKRITDRKYDKPSAYKSGAIVRCRQGKIWKDLKEEQIKNLKVYHSTDNKFEDFSLDYAWDGFWFTNNIEALKNKQAGASGGKYIMTRYITLNNPAGWNEYDKYSIGELIKQGYDGVILPEDDRIDYLVFNPESISKNINEEENISFQFAIEKIDQLPKGKLFDDAKNIEGIFTKSSRSWSETIEAFEKNRNKAQQELLDIEDIHITQPNVQANKVKNMLDKVNSLPLINVVEFEDGEKVIYDAHHRLVTNWALGNDKIKVNLVKINNLQEDESLHKWFKRSGTPGKEGGWVDCNSPIRKDGKITGYKPCGRKEGEKRAKYPSCRPTPAQCKQPGKGKKWGKTK